MIKWALTLTLLLTACAMTGTAGLVDFASLPTGVFYDIGSSTTGGLGSADVSSLGSPLSGITFLYDDQGDPANNGTAQISSSGVDVFAGTTSGIMNGTLEFLFGATPALGGGFSYSWMVAGGMTFHFTLGTVDGSPLDIPSIDGAAITTLNNGGASVSAGFTTGTNGEMFFDASTAPFNQADTQFSLLAANANISDIEYTAPEPASLLLIGTGLLGLGCARKFSRRRA